MLTSLSVLVLYDHLLTLSDEIRLIWPAKVRRTNTNIPPAEQAHERIRICTDLDRQGLVLDKSVYCPSLSHYDRLR